MKPSPDSRFPVARGLYAVAGVILVLGVAQPSRAQDAPAQGTGLLAAGAWQGALALGGGASLRLVFHVGEGAPQALTMDSPDQGVTGIAAGPVVVTGDSVELRVPMVGGGFTGRLVAPDTLEGEWRQGGAVLPLVLVRQPGGVGDREEAASPAPEMRRPQDPRPPFPYVEEEVRVPNADAGIELAGTFTHPGNGRAPAVVLITGSGPQDRDQTILGHRVFAVLADHLTRAGIAVLRCDDRGVGASGGDFARATSEDFAADARAAVAWLAARDDVDASAIGLVGHSEGGLVAPLAAVGDPTVAFVVLLAGPAVPGLEVIVAQTEALQQRSGVDAATSEANTRLLRNAARILAEQPESEWLAAIRPELDAMVPEGVDAAALEAQLAQEARNLANPWMAFFMNHDPAPVLEQLEIPVLALFAELDLQVLPSQNAGPMRALLEGRHPQSRVEVLPGLNHLFQTATTGMPAEYATIDETFAPAALDVIARWIVSAAGR